MGKPPSQPPKPTSKAAPAAKDLPAAPNIETEFERVLAGKVQQKDVHRVTQELVQIAVQEHFSGPMPHPRHLREYEDIAPGSAERILRMAEKSLDHGIDMERSVLKAEVADRKLGMLFGAGLFFALIAAAFGSLFVTDHIAVPGFFLGAAAIGGIAMFIKGRNGK